MTIKSIKQPSIPGIKFEKSFISITLFIILAKASPITEKIATAHNKNIVVKTDISNIPCDEKNRSSGVTIIAVKNPSIVLFGLTLLMKGSCLNAYLQNK